MSRVKNYFENYPKSNECFETSDGLVFHEEHRATAHGDTLKDRLVKTHSRYKVDSELTKEEQLAIKEAFAEKKKAEDAAAKLAESEKVKAEAAAAKEAEAASKKAEEEAAKAAIESAKKTEAPAKKAEAPAKKADDKAAKDKK